MALESVNACPICNGTNFDFFNRCIDFTTSKEEFTIVSCKACQLLITSPRPDSNSIGKYYQSENYISHTNSSKNPLDKVYQFARYFTLKWKLNLIERHKKNGSILDYGCGTGEFLNTCKKANWECNAVEPSQSARKKAEQLTGLTLSDSLQAIPTKKFDVITLWHVLEHIENLNEKISELRQHLAEDGIIFIAVPNHECKDAKTYKSDWAGYDVPRHLWHFSKNTMGKLLKGHSLQLIQIVPMKLDAYYVSLLSEKYKHPKSSMITNLYRAMLTAIQSNRLARTDQNYSSLVYIAKA